MDNNALTAYFSASGVTADVAKKVAQAAGAGLFEIVPEVPYTHADLDWTNKESRSSIEMADKASRVAIAGKVNHMERYDTIYLGFPIWWYVAPHIINSFLEQYDLSGKKLYLFATSGSSGMGRTMAELKPSAPGALWGGEKRFPAGVSQAEVEKWVKSLT